MKRLIPTAVAGFAILMLMMRGFSIESERAVNATNNTSPPAALNTTDGVLQSLTQSTAYGFPLGMLVAGVAAVLLFGLVVD